MMRMAVRERYFISFLNGGPCEGKRCVGNPRRISPQPSETNQRNWQRSFFMMTLERYVHRNMRSGQCGHSADLYFILEKCPSLGAICRLHTGSKTSVPNLSNAVAQLHSWNGGRLKWVKAILKVTPELRWHPGQFGEWESSVVPILSLEIGGATLSNLGTKMNEPVKHLSEAQPASPVDH